ncbi:OLC1v1030841C1 [Oldenlandia corymbosa var. corymbosa]|uniref:OLC1v1030841C1 n=1 Tax=Oldenlandia corymbosa var. corymbosa TaxID=529605 RepID=A0AAV1CKB1_OLDCO|nr:OLC1v1030841C1 [Oldenlandia corymbosa var. corymbosa]
MIDHRHILIGFDLEEDFQRYWMKGFWTFDSHFMRVLKWTSDFNPDHESSIVPIWIGFEGLPVHRFNEEYLRKISSIIGKPLKIDVPTLTLSRPSIDRVCAEVDLLHKLLLRIRLGTEESSYFQTITYENLPEYCVQCRKIGHSATSCRHRKDFVSKEAKTQSNPKKTATKVAIQPAKAKTESWKQKETSVIAPEKPLNQQLSHHLRIISSAQRKISKEHLNVILEKSSEKLHPIESWETEGVAQIGNQENPKTELAVTKHLAVIKQHAVSTRIEEHTSPLKLSDRFDVLAELIVNDKPNDVYNDEKGIMNGVEVEGELVSTKVSDNNLGTEMQLEHEVLDNNSIGSKTDSDEHILAHRGSVSDDEQEQKKRGRPRGSKKVTLIPGTETRRSTRIQGDINPTF